MKQFFHVTSSENRESILRHGLDWRRMSAARGIAGSQKPEQAGCFVCDGEGEADFFVEMNNTGGLVDVWAVAGIQEGDLVESDGFRYVPTPIPADRLTLVRQDVPAPTPDTSRASTNPPKRAGDLHGSMDVIFRKSGDKD